jgi:hypothetical protein
MRVYLLTEVKGYIHEADYCEHLGIFASMEAAQRKVCELEGKEIQFFGGDCEISLNGYDYRRYSIEDYGVQE